MTDGCYQLVTEVDKAVEAFIVKRITETYPDHKLLVQLRSFWLIPLAQD